MSNGQGPKVSRESLDMSTATLTATIDSEDKISFDTFCSDVGITNSDAVNMFVKAVLRERRIPFDITQDSTDSASFDPFYSPENIEYVKKSVAELRAGKGTPHELIEVFDD